MAPVERVDVNRLKWETIGMTPEEAAEALRVHPRTIEDMLRDGKIPGRKVGRQWRIDPDAVKRWLDAFENDPSVRPFDETIEVEERTPDGQVTIKSFRRYKSMCRRNGVTTMEETPEYIKYMQDKKRAEKGQ